MNIGKRKRTRQDVIYLPVEEIAPNPEQPRRQFDPVALEELAESIREYGILNPLTVRQTRQGYELIAGERRLRAAKLAGLIIVPCIPMDVSVSESSLIALVENIQRHDLDFVEEARGIARLISVYGLSQEEAARRLGRSQSAVANKLRILKLPTDVLEALCARGLTERHGRALLRLPDDERRREALEVIARREMTVAQTEEYIDRLLTAPPKRRQKTHLVLKDVRIFLNSVTRGLDLMRRGGIAADMEKRETEKELVVTISIPKN